ncbi:MAG: hypothetical protein JRJ19_01550 [Deltaproteobacteria bacterium]|nr:hypothetical protein [Deltaproteobacteria bacterium]MBW1870717.1 hypothetical protein [Deltaproteobacteria bacterium]
MSAAQGNRTIMLGELLLKAGVITEQQLRAALTEQKKWGGKLGSLLVDMNFLDEDTLVKALSKQLNLPRVDFEGLVISAEAVQNLEADFAEQHQVLPISFVAAKKQLVVAMADPRNLGIVDEIGFKTGCKVQVAIAGEKALAVKIREKYFGENLPVRATSVNQSTEQAMEFTTPLGDKMVSADEDRFMVDEKPTPAAKPGGTASFSEKLKRLELLQKKQVQVLKVVVELLMEKGYFTRDEYRERVDQ